MSWAAAVWDGHGVRHLDGDDHDWTDVQGVLWVQGADGRRRAGRDHYWLADDGTVQVADHHDYDADPLAEPRPGHADPHPVVATTLPDDRHVADGVMVPDEVARGEGIIP